MDPTRYEEISAEIAGSVAARVEELPAGSVRWGRKNRWTGASGHAHQIDVSIAGSDLIALIECKCWSSRVSAEAVLTLHGRLEDIRPTVTVPVQGTLVSRRPVQPGAKALATHFGIQCQVVEDLDAWGFQYANQMVIRPRPISVRVGTKPAKVRITEPGDDGS